MLRRFLCPACRTVTLAFILLTPRLSEHPTTLCYRNSIQLRIVIHTHRLRTLKCVYIFLAPPVPQQRTKVQRAVGVRLLVPRDCHDCAFDVYYILSVNISHRSDMDLQTISPAMLCYFSSSQLGMPR